MASPMDKSIEVSSQDMEKLRTHFELINREIKKILYDDEHEFELGDFEEMLNKFCNIGFFTSKESMIPQEIQGTKMFNDYKALIHNAIEQEYVISNTFDSKREENSIMIQKKLREEADNISKNQPLKDYNPIECYNALTVLKHKHEEIEADEITQLTELQNSTDGKLIDIMKKKPVLPITQICKIVGCAQNNTRYVCRVYFTLLDTAHAKAGDSIRIEWVDLMNGQINDDKRTKQSHHIRNGIGIDFLNIPQFTNPGQITNYNQLFRPNNWGPNSQQKQWWEAWIKENRPIL